jgi:hypothetical protein
VTFRAWRYLLAFLIVTAVAGSAAGRPARAWMPDPTRWGPWQAGSGWRGDYGSAHRVPAGWVVFSNVLPVAGGALCPGASCPGLVRYDGPSLVGPAPAMRARLVVPNKKISDLVDTRGRRLANRMLTRAAVQRDPVDGSWHAIVHVSDGYGRGRGPADGRVEPAYLSSRRGVRWTYHGRLGDEVGAWLAGRAHRGSSCALVLDERPGAGVESKFVLAMDGVLPGGGLALAVSDDGRSGSFLRDGPAGSSRSRRPRSRTRRCTSRAWLASGAAGGGSRSTVVPRPATATWSPATRSFGPRRATSPSRPHLRGPLGEERRARDRRCHGLRDGRRSSPRRTPGPVLSREAGRAAPGRVPGNRSGGSGPVPKKVGGGRRAGAGGRRPALARGPLDGENVARGVSAAR